MLNFSFFIFNELLTLSTIYCDTPDPKNTNFYFKNNVNYIHYEQAVSPGYPRDLQEFLFNFEANQPKLTEENEVVLKVNAYTQETIKLRSIELTQLRAGKFIILKTANIQGLFFIDTSEHIRFSHFAVDRTLGPVFLSECGYVISLASDYRDIFIS